MENLQNLSLMSDWREKSWRGQTFWFSSSKCWNDRTCLYSAFPLLTNQCFLSFLLQPLFTLGPVNSWESAWNSAHSCASPIWHRHVIAGMMRPTGPIPAVGWNNRNTKKALPLYRILLAAGFDSIVLQLMHQVTQKELSPSEQGVPLFLFCEILYPTPATNRL